MFHCKCPCQSGHALNTWLSMCSPMDTLMHTCLDSRERPLVNTHVQSQKYLLILWVSSPSWDFLHSWQVKGVSALAPLLKLKLHRNSFVCSAFVHKDTTAIKTFGLLKTLGSWQRLSWLKVKKEEKPEFQVYIVSKKENIHTGASKFTTNPWDKDPAARWGEIQIINRKALKYITDLKTENTYFFFCLWFPVPFISEHEFISARLEGEMRQLQMRNKWWKMTQTGNEKSHQTKRKT